MPAQARHGYARHVDAALPAAGVHPVEMLEGAGVETPKRMAEAGVAVVPCEAL